MPLPSLRAHRLPPKNTSPILILIIAWGSFIGRPAHAVLFGVAIKPLHNQLFDGRLLSRMTSDVLWLMFAKSTIKQLIMERFDRYAEQNVDFANISHSTSLVILDNFK
jgi:hypothetical protein